MPISPLLRNAPAGNRPGEPPPPISLIFPMITSVAAYDIEAGGNSFSCNRRLRVCDAPSERGRAGKRRMISFSRPPFVDLPDLPVMRHGRCRIFVSDENTLTGRAGTTYPILCGLVALLDRFTSLVRSEFRQLPSSDNAPSPVLSCSGPRLRDFNNMPLARQKQHPCAIICFKHHQAGGNGGGCRGMAEKPRT